MKNIIESLKYRATDIADLIEELQNNKADMAIVRAFADSKNIGIYDAMEAVATHIIFTQNDFVF